MTTAERLQEKLAARQRSLKHNVRTLVPDGWLPYDLMQELRREDRERTDWENRVQPPLKVIQ